MKVHQIMTARVRCVSPDNTLVEAAGLMRQLDIGAVPVCDDGRPIGMLTDRDIALRAVADGRDPNTTTVLEVMSQGIIVIFAEQEVEDLVRLMENKKIRRVPVVDRTNRLVGIVALGDIAVTSNPAFSGLALREVSESKQTLRGRRVPANASRPPLLRSRVPLMLAEAHDGQNGSRDGTAATAKKNAAPEEKRERPGGRGRAEGNRKATRAKRTKQRRGRAAQKGKRSSRRSAQSAERKR